jgi:hypothetical protein
MTIDELREHLTYLVARYVTARDDKVRLLSLIARPSVPAKGILMDLEPFFRGKIDTKDKELVGLIVYNYV